MSDAELRLTQAIERYVHANQEHQLAKARHANATQAADKCEETLRDAEKQLVGVLGLKKGKRRYIRAGGGKVIVIGEYNVSVETLEESRQ